MPSMIRQIDLTLEPRGIDAVRSQFEISREISSRSKGVRPSLLSEPHMCRQNAVPRPSVAGRGPPAPQDQQVSPLAEERGREPGRRPLL